MSNNLQVLIRKELGALSKLQELLLHDNQLTGPIPPELGRLGALQRFQLWRNELSGEIPTSLGLLGNLRKLLLHDNEFSGHIPDQLGALSTLVVLSFGENQLTGSIPAQLGSLRALTILSLHRNRLSGHIPKELGGLSKLQRLWLHRNELTGPIPEGLGALGKLEMLSLSQNQLTVCNAEAFEGPGDGIGGQVERDCRTLEELCVCHWLRSISRRVPDDDVILVATKCDLAGGNPREIGRRMEEACRTWLASWVCNGMQSVGIEDGVCLTSFCAEENHPPEGEWACDWRDNKDDDPSPSLLHRLANKRDSGGVRGAQMVLPRSWDIALTALEALERGQNPVEMAVRHLADLTEEKRRAKRNPREECIGGSRSRSSAPNGRRRLTSLRNETSRSPTPRTHWMELSRSGNWIPLFATRRWSFWTSVG